MLIPHVWTEVCVCGCITYVCCRRIDHTRCMTWPNTTFEQHYLHQCSKHDIKILFLSKNRGTLHVISVNIEKSILWQYLYTCIEKSVVLLIGCVWSDKFLRNINNLLRSCTKFRRIVSSKYILYYIIFQTVLVRLMRLVRPSLNKSSDKALGIRTWYLRCID